VEVLIPSYQYSSVAVGCFMGLVHEK
jgi:hypothetical protein